MSALVKRVSPARLIVLVVALLAAAPLLADPPADPAPAQRSGLADLAAKAPVMSCTDLLKADLTNVADKPAHVTSATEVRDGKPAPYCRVLGFVEPQVSFEVRLPLSGWTQRFLQTGCGGLCGNLNIRVGNDMGCAPSQNGELALASTDMGHSTRGGAWGADHQLRVDFAYRGVHVTSLVAKELIKTYYGNNPKYSYFSGCSDGGREALMEAQRYPQDFDGIAAGAAAMNFITQNTFYHGWNARSNTNAGGKAILTAEDLPILHRAAVESCDTADQLKDGLIADPRACRFDPAVVQCKAGQDPATCLSPEEVETARKIYRGAQDANGRQLVISGPEVGSELSWEGVYVPKTPDGDFMSRSASLDVITGLAYDKPLPANYTLNEFRFDRETLEGLKPMHAVYDATDPDLSKFASAGGKLIIWHGWSDPHISPRNSIAYYRAMLDVMGEERVKKFTRLYLFPGGGHCRGGEGPFNFDLLSTIMAWVETGNAPYRIVAYHTSGGSGGPGGPPEAGRGPREPGGPGAPAAPGSPGARGLDGAPGLLPPTMGKVDRSRPVFPYPLVARYTGKGNVEDAENYEAAMPKEQMQEKFDWLGSSFFTPGYEKW
jgi:hypothetical protein